MFIQHLKIRYLCGVSIKSDMDRWRAFVNVVMNLQVP